MIISIYEMKRFIYFNLILLYESIIDKYQKKEIFKMKNKIKSFRFRFRDNNEKILSSFNLSEILKSLDYFNYRIDDIISIELIEE